MLALHNDVGEVWSAAQAASLRDDLRTIETILNSVQAGIFGNQTAPTQVSYQLGGSTHVSTTGAEAVGVFVDVANANDITLPDVLPPGFVRCIVRCAAAVAGVGVTPRLIRVDTGATVGNGVKFTAVTAFVFQTQEFLITPVTVVPFMSQYYRLQVASDTATSDTFCEGHLMTGRAA